MSKPTRFLIARDWLHRPVYRFRVLLLSRKLKRTMNRPAFDEDHDA